MRVPLLRLVAGAVLAALLLGAPASAQRFVPHVPDVVPRMPTPIVPIIPTTPSLPPPSMTRPYPPLAPPIVYPGSAPNLGDTPASSGTDTTTEPAPLPPPTAEQVWRSSRTYTDQYANNIWLGSTRSSAHVRSLRAILDAPLPGAPAVLAVLHPDADAADIDRLKTASGATGVEAVQAAGTGPLSDQIDSIFKRLRNRPVIVVGHIQDGTFFLENRNGESEGYISVDDLQAIAGKYGVWTFMAGCRSAEANAAVGTHISFDTAQVAAALGAALAASSQGAILRAFADQGLALTVDADSLETLGYLKVQALDDFVNNGAPAALAYITAPPPDWGRLVATVVPVGCPDDPDTVANEACSALKTAADAAVLTAKPKSHFWAWVGGGVLAFLFLLGLFSPKK